VPKSQPIPDEVKQRVTQIIERFNEKELAKTESCYLPRWKGRFLYLDRLDYGTACPICRLTYTGDINKWKFAIFKYSSETYDPQEWLFPGADCVDGTIQGALRAGMHAYSA